MRIVPVLVRNGKIHDHFQKGTALDAKPSQYYHTNFLTSITVTVPIYRPLTVDQILFYQILNLRELCTFFRQILAKFIALIISELVYKL
jgi:hypothetical protein